MDILTHGAPVRGARRLCAHAITAGRLEVGPMNDFRQRVRTFFESDDGPAAVEYAILLALILAGAIVVMSTFGEHVNDLYVAISGAVT